MGGISQAIRKNPFKEPWGLHMFDAPKPKTVKPPPLPAPVAIPEVEVETEDWAMKRARKRRGFTSTILTGALTPTQTGRRTTLG